VAEFISDSLAKLPQKLELCKQEASEALGENLANYDDESLVDRLKTFMKEQNLQPVNGKGKRKLPVQRISWHRIIY